MPDYVRHDLISSTTSTYLPSSRDVNVQGSQGSTLANLSWTSNNSWSATRQIDGRWGIDVISVPALEGRWFLLNHSSSATVTYQTVRQAAASVSVAGQRTVDEPRQEQAGRLARRRWEAEERRHARAERLLWRYLTPEQRRQRRQLGFFDVTAPSGRIYRITQGVQGNVLQLGRGADGMGSLRPVARLCCHLLDVPEPDTHLAQLLWLQADEEGFRRVANFEPRSARRWHAEGTLVRGAVEVRPMASR